MKKVNKVLVVEDNDDHWALMHQVFNQLLPELSGFRAASANEVVKLLEQWQDQEWELPRLIILDLYLPTNQQGFELLSQLKAKDSPCKHIPIILLTHSDHTTDIATAYQLGASSYLMKPALKEDWIAFVRQIRLYWWDTVTLPPLHFNFDAA